MKSMSLEQLQRRFDRLQALQRRLANPPPTFFVAGGRRYDLPLRAGAAKQCADVPQRVLDYMGGFFDGDGCVNIDSSRYRLKITQAQSGSEVLLLFRNVFGGGIYAQGKTLGMHRAALQWSVGSNSARLAAGRLSQSTCCKYDQLLLAESALPDRSRLTILRALAPSRAVCPSWSYLAGFFDAEGHIRLRYPSSIALQIGQKFPHVLHAIQDFLWCAEIRSSMYTSSSSHLLVVNRTEECKHVLRRLLVAGLRVKRDTARISLELTPSNFHHVRSELEKRVGLQSRYKRLTAAGAERAHVIRTLQAKTREGTATSNIALHRHINPQLMSLQATHRLRCAEERYLLLRADIRSKLRHEAWIRNLPQMVAQRNTAVLAESPCPVHESHLTAKKEQPRFQPH
ncbi:USP [Symbiodinium sp. CCMP2456]|nr:USP [Symbiodinium sp. CCMP2456]